jgi:AAA+ ATPase superfamily predicted ATPase
MWSYPNGVNKKVFLFCEKGDKKMTSNPFEYGKPITVPSRFLGRQSELIRIRDACSKLRSVSIVGGRRAGKSSLLRQFTIAEVIQKYDFDSEIYLFCFIDLQGLEDIEPFQFWRLILLELVSRLPTGSPHTEKIKKVIENEEFDNLSLRILFMQLAEYRIVFLFDEFETILASSKFPKSFYGHLRFLAIHLRRDRFISH